MAAPMAFATSPILLTVTFVAAMLRRRHTLDAFTDIIRKTSLLPPSARRRTLVDLNYVEDTHQGQQPFFWPLWQLWRLPSANHGGLHNLGKNGTCLSRGIPKDRQDGGFGFQGPVTPTLARSPVRIDNHVADLQRVAGRAAVNLITQMSPPPMPRPQ